MPRQISDSLVQAWLTARSVARGLPLPVPDRGGLRLDTNAAEEVCRWVFPRLCPGLVELAHEITSPGYLLKLCASGHELTSRVPGRWRLQPLGYMMTPRAAPASSAHLPAGYRIESTTLGPTTYVRIWAADGELAASGYAAQAAEVFIYDRILTSPGHRRRGLGRALMAQLGSAKTRASTQEVLVATQDGRSLYESLGWQVHSPYATVSIPREPDN